jgi:sugar phosphate isomerase/epimerase
MSTSQLAVQLYTLRDFTKTPSEIGRTLARVKKMGYDAVQISALGKIEAPELGKILREEGLKCCASHVSLERLKDSTQEVIDDHRLWGCKYVAIGWWESREAKKQPWIDLARVFNALAERVKGSEIRLGYHNHSQELAKYEGKTAMQILLEEFSPEVWWEIDTYWIQHGGGDPAAWIDKVAGRIPCVHLKDMAILPDRTQLMAEVGEGNLNWDSIIAACRRAGVQWYIIEQDVCQRDPFESLAISLANARGMGLK